MAAVLPRDAAGIFRALPHLRGEKGILHHASFPLGFVFSLSSSNSLQV